MPDPGGQYVPIGEVVGIFGIKGAVKVRALTDFPSRFAPGKSLRTRLGDLKIATIHWHKDQARVKFHGIDTPDRAQALIGSEVSVSIDERPSLATGEYMAKDLIGMRVIERGGEIGVIEDVVKSPAHDLIQVSGCLVPFVSQFIKMVDVERRVVTVELIEGMRPGEQAEESK